MSEDNSVYLQAKLLQENGETRGEQLAVWVANCPDPERLQRFACDCAEHALVTTGLHEPSLCDALKLARPLTTSRLPTLVEQAQVEQAHHNVQRIVEALDLRAFDAHDAVEQGRAAHAVYLSAFRKARAAQSVLECFDPSPQHAAANGCYEAYYATDDFDTLFELGKRTFS